MDIVVAAIAVIAFAATVFVLANTAGRTRRPQQVRTVLLPDDQDGEWLTVEQVATMLQVPPTEVVDLVRRDAIPFYLVRGGTLSRPEYLRFRRDEIDAWTIG